MLTHLLSALKLLIWNFQILNQKGYKYLMMISNRINAKFFARLPSRALVC